MYTYQHKTKGTLYLHKRLTASKRGFLWFFSKDPNDAVDLPPFLEIVESPRTGYPFVRKKKDQINS